MTQTAPTSDQPFRILGVAGSPRAGSRSTIALRLALDSAASLGAAVRVLELRTCELPMFRPDQRAADHPAASEAANAVAWADAFVLSTPDYHGGISGGLKNFLDFHWKPFCGKLFGSIVSSHEKGLTATDQLRTAIRQCYGWSLPYAVAVHSDTDFTPEGVIQNPRLESRLAMLGRDLTVYGRLLKLQYEADRAAKSLNTFATA